VPFYPFAPATREKGGKEVKVEGKRGSLQHRDFGLYMPHREEGKERERGDVIVRRGIGLERPP